MKMQILSFRWSRLAKASAWERLRCRWWYFVIGICAMLLVYPFYGQIWCWGLPVLFLIAVSVVCTADVYLKIGSNKYYIYKQSGPSDVLDIVDGKHVQSKDIWNWEYEFVPDRGYALLYCDDYAEWHIAFREMNQRLGYRVNKSIFELHISKSGRDETYLMCLVEEGVLPASVSKIYHGDDLKVCFTKEELASQEQDKFDYVVAEGFYCMKVWQVDNNVKSVFAAKHIAPIPLRSSPSLIICKDRKEISILVWEYEIYRYAEIYNDEFDIISRNGEKWRFIKFNDSRFNVDILEFDENKKEMVEVYSGCISALDHNTGEYII